MYSSWCQNGPFLLCIIFFIFKVHEALTREKKAREKARNDVLMFTNNIGKHKLNCYKALVNAKTDWLICKHVALDKCNVS